MVEVGCSSGALAKAWRRINPDCEYIGVEIDPGFAEIARASCSQVICANLEQLDDAGFAELFPSDCWIFGDVLEHLYDPWALLKRIRAHCDPRTQLIACIPNAQHWSVQARLCSGYFRYENSGLLDKTHIRWFSLTTMVELFESSGFKIVKRVPRIKNIQTSGTTAGAGRHPQPCAGDGIRPRAGRAGCGAASVGTESRAGGLTGTEGSGLALGRDRIPRPAGRLASEILGNEMPGIDHGVEIDSGFHA
jgi:hypothetical protein